MASLNILRYLRFLDSVSLSHSSLLSHLPRLSKEHISLLCSEMTHSDQKRQADDYSKNIRQVLLLLKAAGKSTSLE